MAGLVLDNVSRVFAGAGFDDVAAVDRLSLEVQDHEFLVLVGPSGCGKSTTLRLIAGLESPSHGQIQIAGEIVNRVPARQRNVAMVFQHPALYPHLTIYKNIAFGLELRERGGVCRRMAGLLRRNGELAQGSNGQGLSGAEESQGIAARVNEVARWLSVEQLLERRPGELSGGERQRVALGRAIVRRPRVFLLDEPLSNLDANLRVEMRRLLADLHKRLETTTVYVTHDQTEALTLGQRVAVMNAGRIEQVGHPRDLYERPCNRFVAAFIGSPPMSFVAGEIRGGVAGRRFAGEGWSVPLPAEAVAGLAGLEGSAGRVELGLRAEAVSLVAAEPGSLTGGLPAVVRRTEHLGSQQHVELQIVGRAEHAAEGAVSGAGPVEHQTDAACVVTKVPAAMPVRRGDRVGVVLDLRQAHWFSAADGRNLRLGWKLGLERTEHQETV
jgi:multiple sugar transport system ATP-binding protein